MSTVITEPPVAVSRRSTAGAFFVPLESLRGVAALIVVMYHALWINPVTSLTFFRNGALMVDFFFVLSGFVIFHSYGNRLSTASDLGKFLWLRLGRLYPLHFAFLMVFFAIECAKYLAQARYGIVADKPAFTTNGIGAFLSNVFLVQALNPAAPLTYNYPSWSISVEFYAYIVFALTRMICGRGAVLVAVAVLVVCACAAALLAGGKWSLADSGNGWAFFRCCGGFFLGILTYFAYRGLTAGSASRESRPFDAWIAPAVLMATIVFLCLDLTQAWSFLLPLLGAAVILSTVAFPSPVLVRLLSCKPLTWLGKVSYSTYMVHAAIVWTLTQWLTLIMKVPHVRIGEDNFVATGPVLGLATLAIYVPLVLIVSYFTFNWIEDPFRRLSKRLIAPKAAA
jgi:peptidoglycan/LPS O-acetylase OafA/YrhL